MPQSASSLWEMPAASPIKPNVQSMAPKPDRNMMKYDEEQEEVPEEGAFNFELSKTQHIFVELSQDPKT